jgi:hypothetical protein
MGYGRDVLQSEAPLAKIGADVSALGSGAVEGLKQDPLGFIADMTPILGEIRSGRDAVKYSDLANEARAANDLDAASMYEQMSTLAAAGATPLIGTAGRIGRRIAGAPNEAMMRMAGSVTPTAADDLAALTAKSTTEAVPITSEPDIQKLISQVPSYYMEEWTQNAGLPQDVVAKYWKLGNDQRDVPERAMVQAQKIIGGGVIFPAIEHIGDLTNRMTPKHSLGFAYEETLGKAKRYLASLKSGYGFRREHEENLKSNADYNKVPYEEHKAKVDAALLNYADAHRALTVYNPLQRLARDTSVALGEQRFEDAGNLLDEFVNRIPTQEAFVEEIKKFDPNFAAPMSNYSLKRQQQRSAGSREAPTAADDLAALTAKAPTDTPEFKNFFGESKVVDAKGKPMQVYHGTSSDFTVFRPSEDGRLGRGIYLSSEERLAKGFRGADKLMRLYVSMQNPAYEYDLIPERVGDKMKGDEYEKELHNRAIGGGFDGIIKGSSTDVFGNPRTSDSWGNFVVFNPTQIKSAIGNEGTFDPTNPVITKAKGGAVTKNNVERMRNDNRRYL